jgi:hypothetical protein
MRYLLTLSMMALVAAATSASPAAAQSGLAMTPEEISLCLCQEQTITLQQSQVDIQGGLLAERQQELANLDTEIKRKAASTATTDAVGQSVLQSMIGQQIALRNLIQLRIRPDYNNDVRALNQTVNEYNAQCTARPRYTLDVQKAQAMTTCPAP